MDFGEYRVTLRTSEGEQGCMIVHAHSDAEARKRAEQASGLVAVSVKRES